VTTGQNLWAIASVTRRVRGKNIDFDLAVLVAGWALPGSSHNHYQEQTMTQLTTSAAIPTALPIAHLRRVQNRDFEVVKHISQPGDDANVVQRWCLQGVLSIASTCILSFGTLAAYAWLIRTFYEVLVGYNALDLFCGIGVMYR
jgi:hypothetical protein